MEYSVPQIQHKLKIFGPFGFKEFIMLIVCFGISIILHQILPFIFFLLISILVFGINFAFIFIKINGASLEKHIQNMLLFTFAQKNYFWKRDKAEIQSVEVISKEKEKEKVRLYQVVRDGALAALSNQINLGVEVEEVSQKTEEAWKELLRLDGAKEEEDQFKLLEKNKMNVEARKVFVAKLKEKQKIEVQTKLKKTYKALEKIGTKRIEKEQKRQQIEERLKAWTQRKKPVTREESEKITKIKNLDIGIKKDILEIGEKKNQRMVNRSQREDESELEKEQETFTQNKKDLNIKEVKASQGEDESELEKKQETFTQNKKDLNIKEVKASQGENKSELERILEKLEKIKKRQAEKIIKKKKSEGQLRAKIREQTMEDI